MTRFLLPLLAFALPSAPVDGRGAEPGRVAVAAASNLAYVVDALQAAFAREAPGADIVLVDSAPDRASGAAVEGIPGVRVVHPATRRLPHAARTLGAETISAEATWENGLSSTGTSGAQFTEVQVDIETGIVKVKRILAIQDCGLIVDKLTAESQVYGGIIGSLNFALFEDRILVLRPTAETVVILDAEQHFAATRARHAPHHDGVHDVAEMEVARRGRGEARTHRVHCRLMIPWLEAADPFPPVEQALTDPNGLLAAGADLSPQRLLDAYRQGIFAWFNDDDPVLWWSPDPRMVLVPGAFRLTRSLRRVIRSGTFQVTLDRAFGSVIAGCAAPREGQPGTWITSDMAMAYVQIGRAHV